MAEVTGPEARLDAFLAGWQRAARRMLDHLGWTDQALTWRRFPGGATLALSAPLDQLLTATEINEWAAAHAAAELGDPPAPDEAATALHLAEQARAEAQPALLALAAAAQRQGVTFLHDPDQVSVGGGSGASTWPRADLPAPGAVDWATVHDVPVVLVTGSNGKTTTVRLLSAIAAAAGHTVGASSTDSVSAAGTIVDRGDWSGPAGARLVLRDRRVTFAVLETARGGILRRGLAATRAVAAIVTNIAEDHVGEWGVGDLETLAATKLVVGRAVLPGGRLVLNADDPHLVQAARRLTTPVLWIALRPGGPLLESHLAGGGDACWLEEGTIVLAHGGARTAVLPIAEVPITVHGAARHNIYNALGAVALASVARLPLESIRAGLRGFQSTSRDNPGRLNVDRLGGVTAIADFAHNPHGMDALTDLARALPATRRLVLLGQAGDRDDEAIRGLARSAWAMRPDHVILKEMEHYLRGRAPGEIPRVLEQECLRLGLDAGAIEHAPTEWEAIRAALRWSRPGDLLLLPTHAEQARVLGFLDRLEREGWGPGTPLPD